MNLGGVCKRDSRVEELERRAEGGFDGDTSYSCMKF